MKPQDRARLGLIWFFAGFLIACSAAPSNTWAPSNLVATNRLSLNTSSTSAIGSVKLARHATLVVRWPKRTIQAIPSDTESVLFQALTLDNELIASASVSRPANAATSSIVLPESQDSYLPIGEVVLLVQAKNGLNEVVAQASQSVDVVENQTISVAMRLVAIPTPMPSIFDPEDPTPRPTATPGDVVDPEDPTPRPDSTETP